MSRALIKKWVVVYDVYEQGEVACTREAEYKGRDIHFNCEKDALKYIEDYIDGEFAIGRTYEMDVYEDSGISYEEIQREELKEKERRANLVKNCPFCGNQPSIYPRTAFIDVIHCQKCNFELPKSIWNERARL